jgi:hypothetical protein
MEYFEKSGDTLGIDKPPALVYQHFLLSASSGMKLGRSAKIKN